MKRYETDYKTGSSSSNFILFVLSIFFSFINLTKDILLSIFHTVQMISAFDISDSERGMNTETLHFYSKKLCSDS